MNNLPVLLIEDNLINIKVITHFLKEVGITNIHVATSGADAIELYMNNIYSLVLLDIGLPDINGLDVCRVIRRLEAENDLPIIAVTAFGGEIINECKLAGCNDCLSKPLNMDTFKKVINEWIIK